MYQYRKAAGLLTLLLAACSDGNADRSASGDPSTPPEPTPVSALFPCQPVGGGDATLKTFCIYCGKNALVDGPKAIDQDLGSAATLKLYNADDTTGQASQMQIRATAQTGTAFATGDHAGLLLQLPDSFAVPFNGTLATLLGDTLQDARNFSSSDFSGQEGQTVYLGLSGDGAATATFDAVQVTLAQVGGGIEEQQFQLFEFCADGSAQAR